MPRAEDLRAPLVEQPVGDELVDGAARLERRVQLDDRVRPEQPVLQLPIDVLGDPLVADDDEAARVVRVVVDEPLSEPEYIHDLCVPPSGSRPSWLTIEEIVGKGHLPSAREPQVCRLEIASIDGRPLVWCRCVRLPKAD